jgi:hypothetical protein
VPRRGPPPAGYPGSPSSYSYDRNYGHGSYYRNYGHPRAWYPGSPRWYYRPYHYDPYGWKHFGWSPLYYVPWSLVWGINTSYFHAHIGFGYPYGYQYPYYSGYPAYPPYPYPYAYGGGGSYAFNGRVRLSIRPRDAQVFVDGSYAGIVDDFDGTFQALRLPPGNYRIEIRMPGFETMELDVHVQPDRTITFREDLRPTP